MSQKNGAQNKRKARVTIVTKPLPSRQNSPSDMANSNPNASNCVTPGVYSNVNNGGKPVENHSFQQLGERLKTSRAHPLPKASDSPFIRAENEDDDGYDPYSDRPAQQDFFEPNPWD